MDKVTEKSNLPPLDKNQQERLQDQEADGLTPRKTKSSRSQRSTNSPRSSSSKRKTRVQHSGSTRINDNYSAENRSEDGILIVEPSDVVLQIENLESAEAKNSRRRRNRSPKKENPQAQSGTQIDESKQEDNDYNDIADDDEENPTKAREVNPEEEEFDENGNRKGFRENAPSQLELSTSHNEPLKSPKLCTLGVELNSLSDSQAPQDPEHSHDHLTNVLTPKSARSIKRPKSTRTKKGTTPRNSKSLRSRSNRAARSIEDENGQKSSKRRQKSPKEIQQRSVDGGIIYVEPSNGVMEIEQNDTLKFKTEESEKLAGIDLNKIADLQGEELEAELERLVKENGESLFSSSTQAAFNSEDEFERERTKTKTTVTTEEDNIIQTRDLSTRDREAAEAAEKRYREEEEELRESQYLKLKEVAEVITDLSAASHRAESRQSRMSRMSRKSRQQKNPDEVAAMAIEQESQQFVLGNDEPVDNTPQTLEAHEPVPTGELNEVAEKAIDQLTA